MEIAVQPRPRRRARPAGKGTTEQGRQPRANGGQGRERRWRCHPGPVYADAVSGPAACAFPGGCWASIRVW